MVFTIEPGLYEPAIGGFRHSDTVAVAEDGMDVLTDYRSDIESLTIRSDATASHLVFLFHRRGIRLSPVGRPPPRG
jgi:hypothetical protein